MYKRAILGIVKEPHDHVRYKVRLLELRRLAEAIGINVVGEVIQSARKSSSARLFGRGKVEEIKQIVEERDADVFIVYNSMKPNQKLNLTNYLNIDVIDRYELTLLIFEQEAHDPIAKLQIEYAKLRLMVPLVKAMVAMRYRGHRPGFLAGGEYGYRRMLSLIRRRMAKLEKEIKARLKRKEERIKKIKRRFPIVCITGYYNAGKTTLFNALTGAAREVSDRPFTTLSPKYKPLERKGNRIMFVDTIGFVLDVDPRFIGSFQLNLLDMKYADLVLFLVSADDLPFVVTTKINQGLEFVPNENVLVVLNKIDLLEDMTPEEFMREVGYEGERIAISAKEKINLDKLLDKITEMIKRRRSSF